MRTRLRSILVAASAALALGLTAHAQTTPEARRPGSPPPAQAAASDVAADVAPRLTKPDLESWLDGFLPYALARSDIAGAVVAVVKGGQVLSEKGYGYADIGTHRRVDPRATLFRPGSISKLFTWTAVMQLVEQGKLDLDADVNRYLDFAVPPRDGKPITLRHLMTHTSGFEDRFKYLFADQMPLRISLADYVKTAAPTRIYPPGEVIAYSNYGAALAGYVVERVSGEPFETYVERHLFEPLGMAHSTFREPVPEPLAAQLSSPYERASLPAKPFEIVGPAPAGALSATGDDIARFMIAHLQNGRFGDARILRDATARAMHAPQQEIVPHLKSWTLGFIPDDRNGHAIIAHDGDSLWFHSRLSLLPDDDVGVYISLNSRRNDAETVGIRHLLMRNFMDRYFPTARATLNIQPTASAHAAQMAGYYRSTQRQESSFLALAGLLMPIEVTAEPDGTLRASNVTGPAGELEVLREVGPYLWESPSGARRLSAIVRNGRAQAFGVDGDLYALFERTPGWASPVWNLPLALATVAILAVTVLSWPLQVMARRHYGRTSALTGRRATLHRLVRLTAVLDLLALSVYGGIVLKIMDISMLDDRMDIWLRTAQGLCLLGLIGAALAVWNSVIAWRDRAAKWPARLASVIQAAACVALAWFEVSLRLITRGTLF
jgi:CubicO group peptidase (beta-lactamase class C family)